LGPDKSNDPLPAVEATSCLTMSLSMHSKNHRWAAVLVLAAMESLVSAAHGQTGSGGASSSPSRTAPRSQSRTDAQPASNARPQNSTARGQGAPDSAPGGQAAGGTIKNLAPPAPFVLTESQQKLLDQILIKWEQQSDKVKTFKCAFTRWEFDPIFCQKAKDFLKSEGYGEIKYKSPDQGRYQITKLQEWDPDKGVLVTVTVGLDHWVCDGKSIFEFDAKNKKLVERPLPPEMQGKAIADGPLPFIFGAKADQLKRRYWMRDVTPKDQIGKAIWLEAHPKFQQDAANFRSATVILNDSDCLPTGLRIFLPDGKNNTDYAFASTKVNDPLAIIKGDFLPPITPFGWTKVVEKSPDPADTPPPPAGVPAQAKRPATPPKRK
jgi:TIGR03009 family protein